MTDPRPAINQQALLKDMILDYALSLARKCCETVMSSDLDFGRIQEKFDAAGTEWAVQVKYWTDDDLIRIDGAPMRVATSPTAGLPEPLQALFGAAGIGDDDDDDSSGSFTFLLPRAWLPERQES